LSLAIHMGISISEFDEMTPYELNLHAEVFMEKSLSEKQESLTLVWMGEYYHRVKNLPRITDELEKIFGKNQKQAMTDEEMLKVAHMLNFQLGGTVEQGGE
jgi:hypothetical protein